ncbi:MAG: hypothetical protein R3A11_02745 [Bdellovibrionota bacterium]
MTFLWIQFLLAVLVIGCSGYLLSIFGDKIAQRTRFGHSLLGTTVIAAVTSFPELGSGISSVAIARSVDLALGGIYGSCMFNLVILCILDVLHQKQSVYRYANSSLMSMGALSIIMITYSGFLMGLVHSPSHAFLSWGAWLTLPLFLSYLVFLKWQANQDESEDQNKEIEKDTRKDISVRNAWIGFAVCCLLVVGSGLYLPVVGEKLVIQMGWSESFFGTLLLAISTSLPELSVTLSSFSIGAINMALGNIWGSNIFNVAILWIFDLLQPGSIYVEASLGHILSIMAGTMMTAVAMLGIYNKPSQNKLLFMTWPSLVMTIMYLLSIFCIF